ncbi:hypothetical protein LG3211_0163 [Lysobacter gummosus]|nr:hypothetical protein LG3211_0163 [Lysobacter gummosus]
MVVGGCGKSKSPCPPFSKGGTATAQGGRQRLRWTCIVGRSPRQIAPFEKGGWRLRAIPCREPRCAGGFALKPDYLACASSIGI